MEHPAAVHWLADYVYGTIATLVAIAGLTFETHPGELTTAGVVIVGADRHLVRPHPVPAGVDAVDRDTCSCRSDVLAELRSSWSIVTAAIPATVIFVPGRRPPVDDPHRASSSPTSSGCAALAVVGIGTAGGRDRPLVPPDRATCCSLVLVGVAIVLLEAGVHLL